MEKLVRTGLLFDFYSGLLTEKQRNVLQLYYGEDWSLAEIAEAEGVSRQAVHDLLHRTERTMEEFETKLGLVKRFLDEQRILSQVADRLNSLLATVTKDDRVYTEITGIHQIIQSLLDSQED